MGRIGLVGGVTVQAGASLFQSTSAVVELVLDALDGFGSKGVVLGEGGTVPCWNGHGTARFHSPSAGNVGARSGRSRLVGDRARARGQGGARGRLVGEGYWVMEWRGPRAHW
jgi:hypothetical protein